MPTFNELITDSRKSQDRRKTDEAANAALIASAYPLPASAVNLPQKEIVNVLEIKVPTSVGIPQTADASNTPAAPINSNPFKNLFAKPANPSATRAGDVLFGTGVTKKAVKKELVAEKKLVKSILTEELIEPTSKLELMQKHIDQQADIDQPQIISMPIPSDIEWDEYQLAALKGLPKQKYACLIGPAGVGKTTVTQQLVKEIEAEIPTIDLNRAKLHQTDKAEYNVAICFCAFTGRAVQQMKRPLPREYHPLCNTIHATLGYAPVKVEYQQEDGMWKEKLVFKPTFTATNQLPFKVCIIDEAGMVPISLWNELLAALPSDCRIILIGDINQLPPVQGRSVLGFAMLKWPTYTLEKIHRQAADNPIIANAHRILQGQFPQKDKNKFAILTLPDGSIKAYNHVLGYIQQLHMKGIFDPMRDALIVPQNKGTLGQLHLNERLVHYFNPPDKNKREVITTGYEHVTYATGDKIMLLQNDRERGLTNGMTGVVANIALNGMFNGARSTHTMDQSAINIDMDGWDKELTNDDDYETKEDDENQRQASHILTVQFGATDDAIEVPFSTAGHYRKITLAYAFTCHKSQGGEYENVIIVVHASNIKMLTREWFYTAVTRAKDKVILLCNDRGLLQCINIQRIKGKTIQEKARSFLALQDKTDTKLPNLPEPVEI